MTQQTQQAQQARLSQSMNSPVSQRNGDYRGEMRYQFIRLVRTLSQYNPTWLIAPETIQVVECLLKAWKSPERLRRVETEETSDLRIRQETKLLVECFLTYLRQRPQDQVVPFHLVQVFQMRSLVDFSFVRTFFAVELPALLNQRERLGIIAQFLNLFCRGSEGSDASPRGGEGGSGGAFGMASPFSSSSASSFSAASSPTAASSSSDSSTTGSGLPSVRAAGTSPSADEYHVTMLQYLVLPVLRRAVVEKQLEGDPADGGGARRRQRQQR